MKKIIFNFDKKTKIILSILLIGIFVPTFIVCAFYKPTKLNKFIASTIYKDSVSDYFNDANLYSCVIESYNSENSTSYDYTYNLSDEQLASIKDVSCKSKNIESAKGIEMLTNIESLNLIGNKLTSIDLSKNTKLTSLNISNNNFTTSSVNMYKTDTLNVSDLPKPDITLPEGKTLTFSTVTCGNNCNISSNNKITVSKSGTYEITANYVHNIGTNNAVVSKTSLTAVELTSDDYVIDNDNLAIYYGDKEFNLDKIVLKIGKIKNKDDKLTINYSDNKLNINYDNTLLKSFIVTGVTVTVNEGSSDIIGEDYIYTGYAYSLDSESNKYTYNIFPKSIVSNVGIVVNNYNDNTVEITINNNVVKAYKVVSYSFTNCFEKDGKIYTLGDKLDPDKIRAINSKFVIDGSKLYLKYNDITLETFDIADEIISIQAPENHTLNENTLINYDFSWSCDLKFKIGDEEYTDEKLTKECNYAYYNDLSEEQKNASDINKDGIVDTEDMMILFKIVAGISTIKYDTLVDVNNDGKMDISDAMQLNKYNAGTTGVPGFGAEIIISYDGIPVKFIKPKYFELKHNYIYSYSSETGDTLYYGDTPFNKDNIKILFGNEEYTSDKLTTEYKDNVYTIKYNNETIGEYQVKPLELSSTTYKINNNNIYIGASKFDSSLITTNASSTSITLNNDKLIVKNSKTSSELKTLNVIKITIPNGYAEDNVIYSLNSDFDINKISANSDDATLTVDNNTLKVTYNDLSETYTVDTSKSANITISSDTYTINDDSIDTYNLSFDKSKIKVLKDGVENTDTNVTTSYDSTSNTYKINYYETTIKIYKVNIVTIESSDYSIDDNYIYYIDKEFDTSKIILKYGGTTPTDDKYKTSYSNGNFIISYNGSQIKTYYTESLTLVSDIYDISDDTIDTYSFDFDKTKIKFKLNNEDYTSSKLTTDYKGEYIKLSNTEKTRADLNKDGVIDENDLRILGSIISKALSSEDYYPLGDINSDGVIDSMDQLRLIKYIDYNNKFTIKYDGEIIKEYKVNTISVISNTYYVDNDKLLIYYGDNNFNIDNITFKYNNKDYTDTYLTKELDGNSLIIKYDGDVVKTYTITPVSISSVDYTIGSDYIYVGSNDLDISKLSTNIGTLNINENTLEVKYDGIVLKTYKVIKVSLGDYNVKNDTIYTLFSDLDITKLSATNAEFVIEDNKLNLKYNDTILKTYNISSVSLYSDIYNISDNTIYISNNTFDINNISFKVGDQDYTNESLTKEYSEDKVIIKLNNNIIKTYTISTSNIESTLYIIKGNNIYYGDSEFNIDNITVKLGSGQSEDKLTKENSNNILTIKYDGEIIGTYNTIPISISSVDYTIGSDYIYVGSNDFDISKVSTNAGTLNVNENVLEVKNNDTVIKTCKIIKTNLDNYIIKDDIIYTFDKTLDLTKAVVTNAEFVIENNKLVLKYGSTILKEYNISNITIYSDKYTINDDSINVFSFTFNKDNILFKIGEEPYNDENITKEYSDNTLTIKYYDNIVKTYKVNTLIINNDYYIIDNDKQLIYYGDTTFDVNNIKILLNNEEVTDITKEYKDNILTINYKDEELKKYTISEIKISSSDYDIKTDYIYVGTNELKIDNISTNIGTLSIDTENNILEVKDSDKVYKKYEIIQLKINNYVSIDNNIYVINDEFDRENISITNADMLYDSDKEQLTILKDTTIFEKYDISIIEITSDKYNIDSDTIHIQDEIDLQEIDVIGAKAKLNEDKTKLLIYVEFTNEGSEEVTEKIVKEYTLSKSGITSDTYDIEGDYIFLYNESFDKEKLSSTEGTIEYDEENNMVYLKVDDKIIAKYIIISVISDTYKIMKEFIYTGTTTYNSKKVSSTGIVSLNNNKIEISFADKVIKSFELGYISLGDLEFENNIIKLDKEISYEDFTSEITPTNVTYKIQKYNSDDDKYEDITSGNIESGMLVSVYKNNQLIDMYSINEDNYRIDDSLNVDEMNKYILDLKDQTTVEKIISYVESSKPVSIYDKDKNEKSSSDKIATGDTLKITMGEKSIFYTLIVKGDVDGDGEVTARDALTVIRHSISIESVEGAYLKAGNVDEEEELTARDALNIIRYSIGLSNTLWEE